MKETAELQQIEETLCSAVKQAFKHGRTANAIHSLINCAHPAAHTEMGTETAHAALTKSGFDCGRKTDPRGAEYGYFMASPEGFGLEGRDLMRVSKHRPDGEKEYTLIFETINNFSHWATDCAHEGMGAFVLDFIDETDTD